MLIRIFLVCSLLFLFRFELVAQHSRIGLEMGPDETSHIAEGKLGVVGVNEHGFFMLRFKGNGPMIAGDRQGGLFNLTLDYYGHNLELLNSIPLDGLPLVHKRTAKEKAFEFFLQDANQNLWLFYSDFENGRNKLYRSKLIEASLSFADPILVADFPTVIDGIDRRSTFFSVSSPDYSHFAIYSFAGRESESLPQVYVEVFDNQMISKWRNDTEAIHLKHEKYTGKFSHFGRSSTIQKTKMASLSNDGQLNVVVRTQAKPVVQLKRQETRFALYSFAEDQKHKSFFFELLDKHIVDLLMIHDHKSNLKVIGTYTDDWDKNGIDGVFYSSFGDNLEVQEERVTEFSNEHTKDFLISYIHRKNPKAVPVAERIIARKLDKGRYYGISKSHQSFALYLHANNTVTLASELQLHRASTQWTCGDLVFLNFGETGALNWIRNFDKEQTMAPLASSVYPTFREDRICFIYNNQGAQAGSTTMLGNQQLRSQNLSRSNLLHGSIDSSGNTTFGLVHTDWKRFLFAPMTTVRVNIDSYIGVAFSPLKQKLIKLTFD